MTTESTPRSNLGISGHVYHLATLGVLIYIALSVRDAGLVAQAPAGDGSDEPIAVEVRNVADFPAAPESVFVRNMPDLAIPIDVRLAEPALLAEPIDVDVLNLPELPAYLRPPYEVIVSALPLVDLALDDLGPFDVEVLNMPAIPLDVRMDRAGAGGGGGGVGLVEGPIDVRVIQMPGVTPVQVTNMPQMPTTGNPLPVREVGRSTNE